MCWAVPARVIRIQGITAQVDFGGGAYKTVVLATEGVREGDLVLVHAGAIIGKMRMEEFAESLELYREMAIALAVEGGLSREEAEKRVDEQLSVWKRWVEEVMEAGSKG